MIAYLTGTVQKKTAKSLIVNTGKVGYLVYISAPLWEEVSENEALELYIYTKVREDDISLYGFKTFSELEFFKLVLGVNGIGPKLGMEMLSQAEKAKNAIVSQDAALLSKIPGIGKKTAERIIVELKNKIDPGDLGTLERKHQIVENQDVIAALEGLGYQKFEISRVFKNLPENITQTEEMITYFLRHC
jgi:Holliday junction DNA helicase RuvA